jgi:hypothetical protein
LASETGSAPPEDSHIENSLSDAAADDQQSGIQRAQIEVGKHQQRTVRATVIAIPLIGYSPGVGMILVMIAVAGSLKESKDAGGARCQQDVEAGCEQ